jgi:protein SCO1/2
MTPRLWLLTAFVALLASVAIISTALSHRPPPAAAAEAFAEQPHTLAPLFPAPEFAYRDQRGVLTTPTTLRGQPYLANFVFTTCRTVCPLLTAKMVQAQRALQDVPVRFVSFSVDPATDTPEVLAIYARTWNPEETRWTLLATDARTLPDTAAGFHVTAMPAAQGQIDPIIHSGVFVLVDAEGLVRGVYDSEHRADWEAALRDVRTLARAPTPPPLATRAGPDLYHQLSCATCHERPDLAPSLHGLAGRRTELETSQVLTADSPYVRESILRPDAKRVRGYPLRMPTYEGLTSTEALDALVAYVLALPADATTPQARAGLATDPVCHMQVRTGPEALSQATDAGTVYFCSQHCRARYAGHPELFQ